jgi:hypothetical protein
MIVLVADAPDGEPSDPPAASAKEHYRRAPWANADVDADINVAIRDGEQEAAASGHTAFPARLDTALAKVRTDPPGTDPDRPVATPSGAWRRRYLIPCPPASSRSPHMRTTSR